MKPAAIGPLAALLTAWLACGLPVAAVSVTSPDIDVRTRVSADSVTVGERLRVVYELDFPDSMSLVQPEGFETGTCRLLSVKWREAARDGRTTRTAELEVMTTDLERARMPRMNFRFVTPSGDTLDSSSDEVDVGVRRVTEAGAEPKPLKPQWEAPRSYAFLLVVAAALAVAALAVVLVRRWRRREIVKAPEPELPADFVALRKLDEIERMDLLKAGEFKKHYTLVADVLRVYLEKRFGILAMDRTTDETLWELRRVGVGTTDIEAVLREADLVKFAKHRPEMSAAKGLVDGVRTVVARTAAQPLAASDTA